MNLSELGLTPAQLAEIEGFEKALVGAWLGALEVSHGLRSPTGWFLAGVRSGTLPGVVPDNKRVQQVHLAEAWIRNAGLFEPDQASLVDALFGEHGRLKAFVSDDALVARMLATWQALQPAAAQVEAERLERARRYVHMHKLGTERTSAAHDAQPLHSSQTSAALTAVSADTGVDADIAW